MSSNNTHINTLQQAARTAAAEGYPEQAQAIYARVAGMVKLNCGGDSMEYASCMHELGHCQSECRCWPKAEASYRQALSTYKKLLHACDPMVVMLMRDLAEVYRHMGNETAARDIERQAADELTVFLNTRQA